MPSPRPFRTLALGMGLALLGATLVSGAASANIRDGAYTVRTKDIGVAAHGMVNGTLRCPTGQRVVSGGAYNHGGGLGPSLDNALFIRGTAPLPDGTGWRVSAVSQVAYERILTIVVTCLPSAAVGPYTVVKTEIQSPLEGLVGGWAVCPTGMRAVTGGAYWHQAGKGWNANLDAVIGSSGTGDLTSWYAQGESFQLNLRLRVTAFCLPLKKVGRPTLVYQDVDRGTYVACPVGMRLVAGGAFWHPIGEGVDPSRFQFLADSTPTTDALGWWASGSGLPSEQLRIVVWCATPR